MLLLIQFFFIFQATTLYHEYLIAKVTELVDTVFFVLRKKKNQITFLHVYHHTMMVVCTWGMLKYTPTYAIIMVGTINSLVHVIMYAYYGLSAFPSLEKYLWWKKYLTAFQLVIIFSQSIYSTSYSRLS